MKVVKSKNYKKVAKGITECINEVLSIHKDLKGNPSFDVKQMNDDGESVKLVVWDPKVGCLPIVVVQEINQVVEAYAKVYNYKVWGTIGTALRIVSLGDQLHDVWSPCFEIYVELNK